MKCSLWLWASAWQNHQNDKMILAQNDQSIRSPHEGGLSSKLPTERTASTQIRMRLRWAHMLFVVFVMRWLTCIPRITKTCLFKYTENFTNKKWKFSDKNSDIFHISAQNIDCGYSLEPPRRGGSNEYPQSMFLIRNKKTNVYPCKP